MDNINKSSNKKVDQSDQVTHTDETFVSRKEYDYLKNYKQALQTKLYDADENYNVMLYGLKHIQTENFVKSTVATAAETEPVTCGNFSFIEKESIELDLAWHIVAAEKTNEKLELKLKEQELKYKEQELKLKEHELKLNELRKVELLDKAIYTQHESNVLLPKNLELRRELQKHVEENEKLRRHLNDEKNELDKIKGTIMDQMNYTKNCYLLYLTTFQNRCNRVILELEDLKKNAKVGSVPSLTEIEYYLFMWKKCLNFANDKYASMLNFYDQETQNSSSIERPVVIPTITLMPEPPSGFCSYFKEVHAKRLEQDYHDRGSRMPYTELIHNTERPEIKNKDLKLEQKKITVNQERNEQEDAKTMHSSIELSFQEVMGAEMNSLVQENLKRRENKVTQKPIGAELNSLRQENLKRENKVSEEKKIPEKFALLPAPAKPVVNSDGLLRKLIQKCPRTPVYILEEAVKKLREAKGSFSGLDSKTLLTDLKKIIISVAKKEKDKLCETETPIPWTTINDEVQQWYRRNSVGNCTICHNEMMSHDSTKLMCRHTFHIPCIKQWFLKNMFCPTCLILQ